MPRNSAFGEVSIYLGLTKDSVFRFRDIFGHSPRLQGRNWFSVLQTVCSPPVLSTTPRGDLSYVRLQGSGLP
ncbi:MAG: hypothetical protein LBF22_04990 [Deltaproteobacteria bacterium]|jgi:hypothetical protein|nr:hypothetical protein [Deltaproteobacteria bacterium]